MLCAVAVRLRFLSAPMNYDEAFTYVEYASLPLLDGLSTYTFPNNHIFHTGLVHLSTRAFGDGTTAVRLPALLAGVALVPATWAGGRALYDSATGLWAAGLVAASSVLIEYSVQARGYTLAALCFCGLLVLGRRTLDAPSWPVAAGFAALGAVAVATIPSMALAVATVATWVTACAVLERRRRPLGPTLRVLAVGVGASAATALAIYVPLRDATGFDYNAFLYSEDGRLDALWDLARRILVQWHDGLPLAIALAVGAACAAGLALHRRLAPGYALPALVGVVPAVLFAAVWARTPPFSRLWLYLLPLYLITAAAALSWATTRLAGRRVLVPVVVPVLVAVALALVIGRQELDYFEDAPAGTDGIVTFLAREAPGAAVVPGAFADAPLRYYFARAGTPQPPTRPRPGDRSVVLITAITGGQPIRGVAKPAGQRVEDLIRSAMLRPAGPPRLLRRFRWVSVYEVPLRR